MNIAPKFDWTDEAVARLKLIADGTRSASDIAQAMGCSRNAIIGKLGRLRVHGAIDDSVRLLPTSAAARRGASKKAATTRKKPATCVLRPKIAMRRKGEPVGPTFVDDAPAAPRHVPIPTDHALTLPPIRFADAIERNRCLFFAGDPYGVSGPDMEVCGAERPDWAINASRYCIRHRRIQYAPREKRAAA